VQLVNRKQNSPSGLTFSREYPDSFQEPISLDFMKLWLRVDYDADDEIIQALVTESRERLENQFGLAIVNEQSITFTLDKYPDAITFPIGPYQSIEEVRIDGVVVPSDKYDVIGVGLNAYLMFGQRQCGTLSVTYKAGWGNNLPSDIQAAIRQDVATRYDQRDNLDNTASDFKSSTAQAMQKYRNVYYLL
jgi:uncharacterized phiE125 gp8 family phage protein